MNKAVFLDRDGVINIDKSYVYKIEEFEFVEGVFECLKHFVDKGYKLIIVTNQSGIGRGYYTQSAFEELTSFMLKEFSKQGIEIEKVYFCPAAPEENSPNRKPKPGMLLQGQKEFSIDMAASWMIGDKKSDIQAGNNAGISQTIYIGNEQVKEATYCVNSILDILDII